LAQLKEMIKLDSTFLHKQHAYLCYKWTLSMTYHFHTDALKVTEMQMLQLTP